MTSPENMGRQFQPHFEKYQEQMTNARGTIRVGDLMGNPNVEFADNVDQDKDIMPQKLGASKSTSFGGYGQAGDSLYDSIKKHGVRAPVAIVFPTPDKAWVMGGHHRIAAAHDIDPNMEIPWKGGINGLPEKYDTRAGHCPMCGGNGVDNKDLDRHWHRLENYDEEFTMSQVKKCHTCSGSGVI